MKTIAKVFKGVKKLSKALADSYLKMHPGVGCGYYIPYDYFKYASKKNDN